MTQLCGITWPLSSLFAVRRRATNPRVFEPSGKRQDDRKRPTCGRDMTLFISTFDWYFFHH
jgi:hypothetical protein